MLLFLLDMNHSNIQLHLYTGVWACSHAELVDRVVYIITQIWYVLVNPVKTILKPELLRKTNQL